MNELLQVEVDYELSIRPQAWLVTTVMNTVHDMDVLPVPLAALSTWYQAIPGDGMSVLQNSTMHHLIMEVRIILSHHSVQL